MLYFRPFGTVELCSHLRREPLRLAIFSIVGLALCWLVISHSFVAYLSTTSPEIALKIRANDSQSLLRLAADEFKPNAEDKDATPESPRLSPSQVIELREKVGSVLINDPLSARAYRLLGQIAEIEGSAQKAAKLMHMAARRSLNEKVAVDWMLRKSVEWKNYKAAAYYADVLLRSTPGIAGYVTPILARMAESPDARPEIETLLATNPSWRPAFFNQLGASLTDARTPLDLFLSLKDSAAPPTTDELNSYESFLFQRKLYELAYYAWLQFLPSDRLEAAGYLFNGGFERKPSGSRFDWRAPPGSNVIVDYASRPDRPADRALVIDFGPGRVEFPGVSQAITLPPGAYALKGSFKGEIRGPRGVQWSARCMNGATLGQSEMILGSHPKWRAFEFPLVVPDNGCAAQMIELKLAARSPSEKLVFGVIWFDDLSISRAEEVAN